MIHLHDSLASVRPAPTGAGTSDLAGGTNGRAGRSLVGPCACTLVGLVLLSAARMFLGYRTQGVRLSPWDALGSATLEWLPWLLLLPLVLRLARARPLGRGRTAAALALHAPASVAASLVQVVLFAAGTTLVRHVRFGGDSLSSELGASFVFAFHTGVIVYWTIVMGATAFDLGRRSRDEALRRAELDRALVRARLETLQAQLSPHFLFNTLNAVAATLRSAPETAERILVRLGDLLRSVLHQRERGTLPLREELDFLRGYLEIQGLRHGERLRVELDIDPRALDAVLPTFLLQPLAENAVQHGIAARPGPGLLRIAAARQGARVEIRVEDDGPGPGVMGAGGHAERGASRGLGLASARERLRLLFGDAASLDLGPRPGGGTAIRLSFPVLDAGARGAAT